MSRCFPFPPPGYEKKARTGSLDLLLKEKDKEKKHKEKKDKGKRDSKERKEKDRSKEKPRHNDQKDKHKDKKKDKEREKDKHNKTVEQRNEEKKADDSTGKIVERSQAEEKKFVDEFVRRIRDGKIAENRIVSNFNGIDQGQIGETNKAKGFEGTEKKAGLVERDDRPKDIESKDKNKERQIQGINRPTEDIQVKEKNKDARTKGIDRPKKGSQVKEKNKERRFEGTDKPKDYSVGNEKRKERHVEGIDKPKEGVVGKDYTREKPINGIDRYKDGTVVNDYNERQIEGIDRPKEEILGKGNWKERQTKEIVGPKIMGKSDIRERKTYEIDGLRTTGDTYKERQIFGIEGPKREVDGKDKLGKGNWKERQTEGIAGPKIMGKSDIRERKTEEIDGLRTTRDMYKERQIVGIESPKCEVEGKDKIRGKESKLNDKRRDKEKLGKVHKGIDHKQIEQKVLQGGDKLQSDILSPAAAYLVKDPISTPRDAVDPNSRKRKDSERNGVFHDELRPNKLRRQASGTTLQLGNGCRLEPVHIAVEWIGDRQRVADTLKLNRVVDSSVCSPFPYSKEHKINGKAELGLTVFDLKPYTSAAGMGANVRAAKSSKPPHPDSKYLSEILAVPKMAELSGCDDEEWLFSNSGFQNKPSLQTEIDGTPQVWEEPLHIESADLHVLPYVIPY